MSALIIDSHNHFGADILFWLRGDFPYAQHLVTMTREGGALGVDRWIVFPFVINLSLEIEALRRGEIVYGGIEKVPYAFENRRLLREVNELFPEEGKRCLPFVMLDPMREQAAQIAELRRLRGDFDFHGLKIQTTMLRSFIRTLGEEGRGFIELAAEWDLPFLIHSSVGDDPWAQASDILDIAEKFPHVRFSSFPSSTWARAFPRSCASSPAPHRRSETSPTRHSQVELGNEEHEVHEVHEGRTGGARNGQCHGRKQARRQKQKADARNNREEWCS